MVVQRQTWPWFGQQREVAVGADFVVPDLVDLPGLRCVGQAVWALRLTEAVCALHVGRRHVPEGEMQEAYRLHVWEPLLQRRFAFRNRQAALSPLRVLVPCVPAAWVTAARAVEAECLAALRPPPRVTAATLEEARERVCADLGWRLPGRRPGGTVVPLAALTVRLATRLQSLDAHAAIAERHAAHLDRVRAFCALPADSELPAVRTVLSRWWRLRVPNVYKEAAWRVALDAFPTARRMQLPASACVACGAVCPCVGHHFWSCSVAEAVRREIEAQLEAAGQLQGWLGCDELWLGEPPSGSSVLPWVWDMVCLAALHAMDVGRSAAWAVSRQLSAAALVGDVAARAAVASFWAVLADFAATTTVPRALLRDAARAAALSRQPFIAWHAVVVSGSPLRVVRR